MQVFPCMQHAEKVLSSPVYQTGVVLTYQECVIAEMTVLIPPMSQIVVIIPLVLYKSTTDKKGCLQRKCLHEFLPFLVLCMNNRNHFYLHEWIKHKHLIETSLFYSLSFLQQPKKKYWYNNAALHDIEQLIR